MNVLARIKLRNGYHDEYSATSRDCVRGTSISTQSRGCKGPAIACNVSIPGPCCMRGRCIQGMCGANTGDGVGEGCNLPSGVMVAMLGGGICKR